MKPTVCIFSLTPVTDEPRVLRQSKAMADAGWDVIVAGFAGRQDPPAYWTRYIEVCHIMRGYNGYKQRWMRLKHYCSRFVPDWAEEYYWWSAGYEGIYQHVAYVENFKCDLVIGHDFFTAPLAARLAKKNGATYSIDAHEYSRGQYMHDPNWRKKERPWVHAIQQRYLPKSSVITTVCDGIADLLQEDYDLPKRPLVVRSTAFYSKQPFRKTNPKQIDVLYHGILAHMRGLEEAIASVSLWRPEFHFIIRGPGPEDYLAELKSLIKQYSVEDRVIIDPPVSAKDLVSSANKADIGFFVQPNISPQKRFTLPNKFFEYTMAGLALCVADLPEMARIVKEYDLGRIVPTSLTPEAIAEVINGFTPDTIDAYKKKSLKAAKDLSWENESQKMMAAYDELQTHREDA